MKEFQRQRVQAVNSGRWSYRVGKDGRHVYRYRNPWIPCLFSDATHIRPVVGPTRQWLAPRCPTCAVAEASPDEIDPAEFGSLARQSIVSATYTAALKQIAAENGMLVHSRRMVSAKRAIEDAMREKQVSLERLLDEAGINR